MVIPSLDSLIDKRFFSKKYIMLLKFDNFLDKFSN